MCSFGPGTAAVYQQSAAYRNAARARDSSQSIFRNGFAFYSDLLKNRHFLTGEKMGAHIDAMFGYPITQIEAELSLGAVDVAFDGVSIYRVVERPTQIPVVAR